MRKSTIVAGAVGAAGIAGGLGYLLMRGNSSKEQESTMRSETADDDSNPAQTENNKSEVPFEAGESPHEMHALDDRGTDQEDASQILRSIRDGAFDGSDEKLALALGRPTEEIERWTTGSGTIDGDVILKARGLANLRGINIEGAVPSNGLD
jgi:hypothetical protein